MTTGRGGRHRHIDREWECCHREYIQYLTNLPFSVLLRNFQVATDPSFRKLGRSQGSLIGSQATVTPASQRANDANLEREPANGSTALPFCSITQRTEPIECNSPTQATLRNLCGKHDQGAGSSRTRTTIQSKPKLGPRSYGCSLSIFVFALRTLEIPFTPYTRNTVRYIPYTVFSNPSGAPWLRIPSESKLSPPLPIGTEERGLLTVLTVPYDDHSI